MGEANAILKFYLFSLSPSPSSSRHFLSLESFLSLSLYSSPSLPFFLPPSIFCVEVREQLERSQGSSSSYQIW